MPKSEASSKNISERSKPHFVIRFLRLAREPFFLAKIGLFATSGFLALSLLYGFLWGPLIAYSPVKPGFTEVVSERYTLIYPKGMTLPSEYAALDDLLSEVERLHRLTFIKQLRFVICTTQGQYNRFALAHGRACAIQTGTVIYLGPEIQQATYPPQVSLHDQQLLLTPNPTKTPRDLTSFVKHELSHALIYQNTSLIKAFKIDRWFEEGLAVYFGNAHHYYQDEAFKTLAIAQGFFFDLLNNDAEPEGIPNDIKYFFMYGAYAEFMGYLIETYGLDKVLDFCHVYINTPDQQEELFSTFFAVSPHEALEQFWQSL
jgi:hypothetical protein